MPEHVAPATPVPAAPPVPHPYDAALEYITEEFTDDNASQAHTTMIGLRKKDGKYVVGEPDVLVVQTTTPKGEAAAYGDKPVPPNLILPGGEHVPIDVQASIPVHTPKLLRVGDVVAFSASPLAAATAHQSCHQPLVKGGCQIQPPPGQWVGTCGGMMGFLQPDGSVIWGVITNAHVSGLDAQPGTLVGQPLVAKSFARIIKVFPISKNQNVANLVDLAILDCRNSAGKLTCAPDQVTLGRLASSWKNAVLRMPAAKDGRTTGGTSGICVGIKATSNIGYGQADVRRLTDLDVFAQQNGQDMSGPGDSGSYILESGTNVFISLLFAGGSGQTLACAARNVIAACNGILPSLA